MARQIGYVHITPFQRKDHSHQGLDNQSSQIRVVGGENNLFFLEDRRQNLLEGRGSEGQVEEVADLVERVSLQFIEMKNLSVGVFLQEDGLPYPVLVTHRDVVVESELQGRSYLFTLADFPENDGLPLVFPPLVGELKEDSVHIFIDWMSNHRLLFLEFFKYF